MYLAVCDDQESDLNGITALLERWQEERRTPLLYPQLQKDYMQLLFAVREE